jgi:hypothetical protein
LGNQRWLERGKLTEDTVTKLLHVGPKIDHLLISQSAGVINAAAIGFLVPSRKLGL